MRIVPIYILEVEQLKQKGKLLRILMFAAAFTFILGGCTNGSGSASGEKTNNHSNFILSDVHFHTEYHKGHTGH